MATFVSLFNFTDQGIRNVKDTTKRYEAANALAQKMGVKITHFFYTMGPYDCMAVCEAKSEEDFNAFTLSVANAGNVRSLTLRAFSVEDMSRIVSKMA